MSNTEQMRDALEKIDLCLSQGNQYQARVELRKALMSTALTAPAAEVPEAMGDAEINSLRYLLDVDDYDPKMMKFASAILRHRDAQWQSTRLRGGVPELPEFDALDDEVIDAACTAGSIYRVDLMRAWNCIRAMLTAAPQATALDAGVVRDAASDDMTRKWCWWLGEDETFHIADTESEAHGEAQCRIDDDCESGQERKYHVARVQHPIDSLGLDWLARNVAEHIEENVCCWCDENTGAEEPSITLAPDDKKALGLMVAGFLREKAGVDWWTYDKTTVTEHTYVAGNNDSTPDAAMSAQAGKGGA